MEIVGVPSEHARYGTCVAAAYAVGHDGGPIDECICDGTECDTRCAKCGRMSANADVVRGKLVHWFSFETTLVNPELMVQRALQVLHSKVAGLPLAHQPTAKQLRGAGRQIARVAASSLQSVFELHVEHPRERFYSPPATDAPDARRRVKIILTGHCDTDEDASDRFCQAPGAAIASAPALQKHARIRDS